MASPKIIKLNRQVAVKQSKVSKVFPPTLQCIRFNRFSLRSKYVEIFFWHKVISILIVTRLGCFALKHVTDNFLILHTQLKFNKPWVNSHLITFLFFETIFDSETKDRLLLSTLWWKSCFRYVLWQVLWLRFVQYYKKGISSEVKVIKFWWIDEQPWKMSTTCLNLWSLQQPSKMYRDGV